MRHAPLLLVTTVSLISAASPAHPQVRAGVGGGASVPTGGFSFTDDLGWHALGTVLLTLPSTSPFSIRGDLMFARHGHKTSVPGHTALACGIVNVLLSPWPRHRSGPYLLAGLGSGKVTVSGYGSASEVNVALNAGVGVRFVVKPIEMFVEGRFATVRTSGGPTNVVPLTAGVSFGVR